MSTILDISEILKKARHAVVSSRHSPGTILEVLSRLYKALQTEPCIQAYADDCCVSLEEAQVSCMAMARILSNCLNSRFKRHAIVQKWSNPENGLHFEKMAVPLGVVLSVVGSPVTDIACSVAETQGILLGEEPSERYPLLHQVFEGIAPAQQALGHASVQLIDKALLAMSQALKSTQNIDTILSANQADLEAARAKGDSAAILDRLALNAERLEAMATSLELIAKQPSPFDVSSDDASGVCQIAAKPLGAIGMIYEARPNVTSDAAGICLKSGNVVVLRPGSSCFASSSAIADCLQQALQQVGLPKSCLQLVPSTDRAAVGELLKARDYLDMIIPRGGESLTRRVDQESLVPSLLHLDGICHTYIHEDAEIEAAIAVTVNAKCRRFGICGATETILIHEAIAERVLLRLATILELNSVKIVGDETVCALMAAQERNIPLASEVDWATEYLAPVVSIRIVASLEQAIAHINQYGSGHSDAIITTSPQVFDCFALEIASANIMWNASTQFADGGEFGFGAEIGIATGRIHARGPVGAEHLVSHERQLVKEQQNYTLAEEASFQENVPQEVLPLKTISQDILLLQNLSTACQIMSQIATLLISGNAAVFCVAPEKRKIAEFIVSHIGQTLEIEGLLQLLPDLKAQDLKALLEHKELVDFALLQLPVEASGSCTILEQIRLPYIELADLNEWPEEVVVAFTEPAREPILGISKSKLQARGVVGIEQLQTFAYRVIGNAACRAGGHYRSE